MKEGMKDGRKMDEGRKIYWEEGTRARTLEEGRK
jgi:hypothetical protein